MWESKRKFRLFLCLWENPHMAFLLIPISIKGGITMKCKNLSETDRIGTGWFWDEDCGRSQLSAHQRGTGKAQPKNGGVQWLERSCLRCLGTVIQYGNHCEEKRHVKGLLMQLFFVPKNMPEHKHQFYIPLQNLSNCGTISSRCYQDGRRFALCGGLCPSDYIRGGGCQWWLLKVSLRWSAWLWPALGLDIQSEATTRHKNNRPCLQTVAVILA